MAAFLVAACVIPDDATATQMVNEIVDTNNYPVSNITYSGLTSQSATYTDAGTDLFGSLSTGILLTTGTAANAEGPNDDPTNCTTSTEGRLQLTGDWDDDIEDVFGRFTSEDAVYLQFEIDPNEDAMTVKFAFASNEYAHESSATSCEDSHEDGCAILMWEKGAKSTTLINIAEVGTNDDPVAVDYVNGSDNSSFFVRNVPNWDEDRPSIGYNGATTTITKNIHNLDTSKTYVIKIVVADFGDDKIDSAIIIGNNGFDN